MATFKTCLCCGETFGPVDRLKAKYCCAACASAARVGTTLKSKGKARPHTQRAESRPCATCGAVFRAVKDCAGKKPQQYCSIVCWRVGVSVKERECPQCKTLFRPSCNATRYCCKGCRDLHYRVRLRGSNSPLWQGGKTSQNKLLRTSVLYREWRKKVFTRDKYTCVICGARSAAGAPVELHPDHIFPLSERPDLAYELSNGRTLCAPCHKQTDTWAWRQRWKNHKKIIKEAV